VRGIIIIIMVWAMLIAWTGKLAQSRGRNPYLWSFVNALAGACAFGAGTFVTWSIVDSTDSTSALLIVMFIPLVTMIAAMVGIARSLDRQSTGPSRKKAWTVHILKHGDGHLRIEKEKAVFEWSGGSRDISLRELERVEVDGECVRVHSGEELVVIPTADGLSPEGRRHVSKQIAHRLKTYSQPTM
jgi:hypothetical protein